MTDIESHLIPKQLLDNQTSNKALSVSQLNRAARDLLEGQFFSVLVEGEISNFSKPASGHWYFTLKDANAQIRCAMFRNRNMLCRVKAANGIKIALRGKISLYEARGEYQLIADSIQEAGIGDLQVKFEALKQRLQDEGLFLQQHKQRLPEHPKRIAVVTSKTGAAVRDIVTVFKRRCSQIILDIIPVTVQGDSAAPQIAAAIDWLGQLALHDAIIVGRGGGSIEDLWAFNEALVARAIFNCPIPTISAVGHETDITIADFVADARAPTPSAAAELLSPDNEALRQRFKQLNLRLTYAWRRNIRDKNHRLANAKVKLKHPSSRLEQLSLKLDDMERRLVRALTQKQGQHSAQIKHLSARLRARAPQQTLFNFQQRLAALSASLERSIGHCLKSKQQLLSTQSQGLTPNMLTLLRYKRQQLSQQVAVLNTVNPLQVVQRGYSITRDAEGKLIKLTTQVNTGDKIQVQLPDGDLHARIESIDTH